MEKGKGNQGNVRGRAKKEEKTGRNEKGKGKER